MTFSKKNKDSQLAIFQIYKNHRTNPETLPSTPKEPHKGSMGKQSTLSTTNWKWEKRLEWWRPGWGTSTWIRLAVKSTMQAPFAFFNSILFCCYAKLIYLKHSCNSSTFLRTVLEKDPYYWTTVRMWKTKWNTFKKCQPQDSSKYVCTKKIAINFNEIFSCGTFTGFSPMAKV